MARHFPKSVTIEAEQFNKYPPFPEGVHSVYVLPPEGKAAGLLRTLGGAAKIQEGDWIVTVRAKSSGKPVCRWGVKTMGECPKGHGGPFHVILVGSVDDQTGEPCSDCWLQCRFPGPDGFCDERFPLPEGEDQGDE